MLALLLILGVQDPAEEALRRLDDDRAEVREEAQEKLWEIFRDRPPRDRVILEKAKGRSAEVRLRVTAVLARLAHMDEGLKVLDIFDVLDWPDVSGMKFVRFNVGRWWGCEQRFGYYYHEGWIVNETPEVIELMDPAELVLVRHERDRTIPEEGRSHVVPKDHPHPGEYVELDLVKTVRWITLDKKTEYLMPPRYAWFLLKMGRRRNAWDLVEAFEKGMADRLRETTVSQLIRDDLVYQLRYHAFLDALHGEPREKLIATWRLIGEKLPRSSETNEARAMVAAYERQIRELEALKEPQTLEEKARYWIAKLVEVRAMQTFYPGSVSIFEWHPEDETPNPARELVKLGWPALPILFESFDDPDPTRSVGGDWTRPHDFHHLLRVGEACAQIAEQISLRYFHDLSQDPYIVLDGSAGKWKREALAFWEEYGNRPEAHYLEVASSDRYFMVERAVKRLLELDVEKHLPVLVALVQDPGTPDRTGILSEVAPRLTKTHKSMLEKFLNDEDPNMVTRSAEVLWMRWKDDQGGRLLLDWIRSLRETDSLICQRISDRLHVLSGIRHLHRQVAALMSHPLVAVRHLVLRKARGFPCRSMYRAVRPLLADRSSIQQSTARVCDHAAGAIQEMLGRERLNPYLVAVEERDRVIAELKAWCDANPTPPGLPE